MQAACAEQLPRSQPPQALPHHSSPVKLFSFSCQTLNIWLLLFPKNQKAVTKPIFFSGKMSPAALEFQAFMPRAPPGLALPLWEGQRGCTMAGPELRQHGWVPQPIVGCPGVAGCCHRDHSPFPHRELGQAGQGPPPGDHQWQCLAGCVVLSCRAGEAHPLPLLPPQVRASRTCQWPPAAAWLRAPRLSRGGCPASHTRWFGHIPEDPGPRPCQRHML